MKVFHLNILDTKAARDELNGPNGGWSSQPRFTRYADITCSGDKAQVALAWLVGEYTYVAHVDTFDLEDAWTKTQHLAAAWDQNDDVTAMRVGNRSTSVGDIIEDDDGHLHLVANVGFRDIDPIGMAKRSSLNELI